MRSRAVIVAISAALAAVIAGCGGASNNGVAAKSPHAILAAATNAISGVKSVHVSGSVVNNGSPITLDLNLTAGKGGSGRMSENGLSFQVIVVNHAVYINGSDSFWRHFGGSAAAQLFHGKWLRGPTTGQLASVAALADLQALFNKLLSHQGTLTKGATSTVDGQKVVAVRDSSGGTLYVATTGNPYPIEVSKSGSVGGRVIFDRYSQAVSASPPAKSIDITKLR
jgi:hypothetical protein